MKRLWVYMHAALACAAWLMILLALTRALLDSTSNINRDPVFTIIAVLLTIGHASSATYLMRRIREEILVVRCGRAHTIDRTEVSSQKRSSV